MYADQAIGAFSLLIYTIRGLGHEDQQVLNAKIRTKLSFCSPTNALSR